MSEEEKKAPELIVSSSPHIHAGMDVPRIMRLVLVALLPALLVGFWFFGLHAIRVTLIAVLGCLVFEWAFLKMLKRPGGIGDGSALVTAILLAMNLPSGAPTWMVLVGSFIAIIMSKQIFGGLGTNPFNPALVARVFLLISFPVQMTTWARPAGPSVVDAETGATPLGALSEAIALGKPLGEVELTPLMDLFIGARGGSLGEASVVALLLGGLFLLWKGLIRWQIPVAMIATVALITGTAHWIAPHAYASPVYHVLSGGLFLGAFFMATDMVTSPVTRKGMLIFGIGCGVLTAVIRLWGGYPEGVSFAILLMNAATPLIDRATKPKVFGAARKIYEEAA